MNPTGFLPVGIAQQTAQRGSRPSEVPVCIDALLSSHTPVALLRHPRLLPPPPPSLPPDTPVAFILSATLQHIQVSSAHPAPTIPSPVVASSPNVVFDLFAPVEKNGDRQATGPTAEGGRRKPSFHRFDVPPSAQSLPQSLMPSRLLSAPALEGQPSVMRRTSSFSDMMEAAGRGVGMMSIRRSGSNPEDMAGEGDERQRKQSFNGFGDIMEAAGRGVAAASRSIMPGKNKNKAPAPPPPAPPKEPTEAELEDEQKIRVLKPILQSSRFALAELWTFAEEDVSEDASPQGDPTPKSYLTGMLSRPVRTLTGMMSQPARTLTGMMGRVSNPHAAAVQRSHTGLHSWRWGSAGSGDIWEEDTGGGQRAKPWGLARSIYDLGGKTGSLTYSGTRTMKSTVIKQLPGADEVLQELHEMQKDAEATFGQGIAGKTWEHGSLQTFTLKDMLEDPEADNPETLGVADKVFSAAIGVPVFDQVNTHKMVGVIVLYLPYDSSAPRGGEDTDVADYVHHYLSERANKNLSALTTQAAELMSQALTSARLRKKFVKTCKRIENLSQERARARWRRLRVLVLTGWMRQEGQQVPRGTPKVRVSWKREWFEQYFRKWRGKSHTNPIARADAANALATFVGVFLALGLIGGFRVAMKDAITDEIPAPVFMLFGSFGALATLLFAAPASPFAQPRIVLGGHLIGCVTAVTVDYFTNPAWITCFLPQWIASPLVVATVITIMTLTGFIHPPGAAAGLIFISANEDFREMGWWFIIPVQMGCLISILSALIVNNTVKTRHYPTFW